VEHFSVASDIVLRLKINYRLDMAICRKNTDFSAPYGPHATEKRSTASLDDDEDSCTIQVVLNASKRRVNPVRVCTKICNFYVATDFCDGILVFENLIFRANGHTHGKSGCAGVFFSK